MTTCILRKAITRRFYIRSAPFYRSTQFDWTVRLEKAHEDRDRKGDYE